MKTLTAIIAIAVAGLIVGCQNEQPSPVSPAEPLGKTVIRPLSDFLDNQGTYCIDDGSGGCFYWWGPVDNYLGWANMGVRRFALVDYAGVADRWIRSASGGTQSFGTTFTGSVKETELKDGTVEVSVDLITKDALAFACTTDAEGNFGPMIFGNQAQDVLLGQEPALVDCHLKVDFILPHKGDPIPDIVAWLMGATTDVNITNLSFEATGPGPLHAAFGVPEGTDGKLHVTQVAHLASPTKSKNFDGFPVETVLVYATGK